MGITLYPSKTEDGKINSITNIRNIKQTLGIKNHWSNLSITNTSNSAGTISVNANIDGFSVQITEESVTDVTNDLYLCIYTNNISSSSAIGSLVALTTNKPSDASCVQLLSGGVKYTDDMALLDDDQISITTTVDNIGSESLSSYIANRVDVIDEGYIYKSSSTSNSTEL